MTNFTPEQFNTAMIKLTTMPFAVIPELNNTILIPSNTLQVLNYTPTGWPGAEIWDPSSDMNQLLPLVFNIDKSALIGYGAEDIDYDSYLTWLKDRMWQISEDYGS